MLQIGELSWVNENTLSGLFFFLKKQDPVSNMQKTGLTNHSFFLIWSGLEKGITYGCDLYGEVNNHFPVY